MSAINKDQCLKISKQLYEKRSLKNSLHFNIINLFSQGSGGILTLRFEDYDNKEDQNLFIN